MLLVSKMEDSERTSFLRQSGVVYQEQRHSMCECGPPLPFIKRFQSFYNAFTDWKKGLFSRRVSAWTRSRIFLT